MTEIVGMAILHMIMNIFSFLLLAVIFKLLGAWTAEFDTLILLLHNTSLVDWELTSSFAAKTTNTKMGNRSPCISQTSMSLKEELSGSFSWIPSYSVYITRLDVSATIINASKWDSSMISVSSAARIRHIDGMKRDIHIGPESLLILISRDILESSPSLTTSIEHLVTLNLFSVGFKYSSRPHFIRWLWFLSVPGTFSYQQKYI